MPVTRHGPVVSFHGFSFRCHTRGHPALASVSLRVCPKRQILVTNPSNDNGDALTKYVGKLGPFSGPNRYANALAMSNISTPRDDLFRLSTRINAILRSPSNRFVKLAINRSVTFTLRGDYAPRSRVRTVAHRTTRLINVRGRLNCTPRRLSNKRGRQIDLTNIVISRIGVLLFSRPLTGLSPTANGRTVRLVSRVRGGASAAILVVRRQLRSIL